MTKRRVLCLIHKYLKRLGLEEWQPAIKPVNAKTLRNGHWGRVTFNRERLEAIFSLPLKRKPPELEQTIAHECAHLLLTDIEKVTKDAIGRLSSGEQVILGGALDEQLERACCRLARALTDVNR